MSDYKLVPFELTDEMVNASGCEGHFKMSPHEQAQKLWEAMLDAAPDVQGEPVGWKIPGVDRLFTSRAEAELSRLTGQCAVPLYTAPKPAPDVSKLVEALSASIEGIEIPSGLTQSRAEFFKAGVRAAANQLSAVLAAYRIQGGDE